MLIQIQWNEICVWCWVQGLAVCLSIIWLLRLRVSSELSHAISFLFRSVRSWYLMNWFLLKVSTISRLWNKDRRLIIWKLPDSCHKDTLSIHPMCTNNSNFIYELIFKCLAKLEVLALMCRVCSKLGQGIYYETGLNNRAKSETWAWIGGQTEIGTLDLGDDYPVP